MDCSLRERSTFFSHLKTKVDLIITKAAALRITLNKIQLTIFPMVSPDGALSGTTTAVAFLVIGGERPLLGWPTCEATN